MLSPSSGSAKEIADALLHFLKNKNISTANITAVEYDGTAVNTGVNGGILRIIEETLEKPLQWIICLMHANELPLRHIFCHLDGVTSGPLTY